MVNSDLKIGYNLVNLIKKMKSITLKKPFNKDSVIKA